MTRRGVQLGLGLLWLLDSALQFQPYMFSRAFARHSIAAMAAGQPHWVAAGVRWAAGLMAAAPVATNTAFATVQLLIAVMILWRPSVRFGLAASIAWSAGVWYFGEALGGLAAGHASLLSGAPGAVMLYALLAVLAWPRGASIRRQGDSQSRVPPWAAGLWAAVWLGGAVLQLLPSQSSPSALSGIVQAGAGSGWLAGADRALAAGIRHVGVPSVVMLVVLFAGVGVSGLYRGWARRFSVGLGLALSAAVWLLGEGLGGISSGQATDPNSAPLLALLAVTVWGAAESRRAPGTVIASAPTARTVLPVLRRVLPLVALPGLLAGAAVVAADGAAAPTAVSASAMPTGMVMPARPSAAARMICGAETRRNVADLLGLPEPPVPSASWSGQKYTCVYHVAAGTTLVLAVQESPGVSAAHEYFSELRRSLGGAQPLTGMAGLGLPAYQTGDGVVVFLKDADTLVVDARTLPGRLGPTHDSRNDVAYSLATDVIACWRGE